MLNWIIDFSLRHRFLVIVAAAMCAAVGAVSLRRLDIDAFPDTTPVQVQINTVAPALGAGGGRAANHLSHRAGAQRAAGPGAAALRLQVRPVAGGRHLRRRHRHLLRPPGRQRAARHASSCPPGIERPKMGPVATGLGEVFHYVVTGKATTLELPETERVEAAELRTVHDWVIKPQAAHGARAWPRSTPGAATRSSTRCASIPDRLIKHGLTFDEVVEAVEQEQPQRRRRQHPPATARCSWSTAWAARSTSSRSSASSSRPRTACRSASRDVADVRDRPRDSPRRRDGRRQGRGGPRPRLHAHGREQPRGHLGD